MTTGENRKSLKVLTYNLWHGLNPVGMVKFEEYETPEKREERIRGFLRQAKAIDPDILFLQEVNPAPSLSRRIARELGCDYVYTVGNAGIKIGGLGLPVNLRSGEAILAKKDLHLEKLGGPKLSGPFGWCTRWGSWQLAEFRYALLARISVGGRSMLLMNTHLHHGLEVTGEFREEIDKVVAAGKATRKEADEAIRIGQTAAGRRRGELETALGFAGRFGFADSPMLFAGDFNASPDAPELVWLKQQLGFVSITDDDDPDRLLYTWDPLSNENTLLAGDFKPANAFEKFIKDHFSDLVVRERRRLDYVFYRNMGAGFSVREAGLFGNELQSGRMASDHFGIWGELRLGPDPGNKNQG